MNTVAEIALWLGFLCAAWATGALLVPLGTRNVGPGARDGGVARSPLAPPRMLIAAGALVVFAWGALGGAVLRGDPALALWREGASITVGGAAPLAALWATRRGAILTLALLLLFPAIGVATARDHDRFARRLTGVLAATATVALAVSVLALPPFAGSADAVAPASVPLHLVHWGAGAAALFALGTVALTLVLAGIVIAASGDSRTVAEPLLRRVVLSAWILATLAIAAEQSTRGALGITGQDAVVLGSSRSGLLLWLALAVLLHARARRILLGREALLRSSARGGGWPAHAAHLGAALVVAAFVLHIAARRETLTLRPGEPVTATDVYGRSWRLVPQGVSRYDAETHEVTALAVEVTAPDGATRLVSTEQRTYLAFTGAPMGDPVGIRGTWRTPVQDVRLVVEDVMPSDAALVRVSFVPLVLFWPAGIALMVAAGLVLLSRSGRFPDSGVRMRVVERGT